MNIDPKYLEMTFEAVGVRNSQKRLKSLIAEQAIAPLNNFQDQLVNRFDLIEEILTKRIARAIVFWCEHKHDPLVPQIDSLMGEITNSSQGAMSLADFFRKEVKDGMYVLAPMFGLEIPDHFKVSTDELEFALLELEERFDPDASREDSDGVDDEEDYVDYQDVALSSNNVALSSNNVALSSNNVASSSNNVASKAPAAERRPSQTAREATPARTRERQREHREPDRAIVSARQADQVIEVKESSALADNRLSITAEDAWGLIYGLIGYSSDYVQNTLLPRWQEYPSAFDKDRRFLYGLFIDTIRNAAGLPSVSGNYRFADRNMTIDQLWGHFFTDLSQNVAPALAAARIHTNTNDPWHKKLRQSIMKELGNFSLIWLLALTIALIFDGLTTYISLDQTPMDGPTVLVFTLLITALFQIADQMVINYRRREFEAEALAAKYHAQFERLSRTVADLDVLSDSYVQLSMEKSKANADWKATEDNRKMARRGRFWSARIADINVIVTAYGFAFMFLNAEEPMAALFVQLQLIVSQQWASLDIWVFLMVGMAVTVSFVVNTAQRTEILGWSMRRMKNES